MTQATSWKYSSIEVNTTTCSDWRSPFFSGAASVQGSNTQGWVETKHGLEKCLNCCCKCVRQISNRMPIVNSRGSFKLFPTFKMYTSICQPMVVFGQARGWIAQSKTTSMVHHGRDSVWLAGVCLVLGRSPFADLHTISRSKVVFQKGTVYQPSLVGGVSFVGSVLFQTKQERIGLS